MDVAFSNIQGSSQLGGNIDLPLSNKQGYSLVFNSDGTVTVYKVLSTANASPLFPVITAPSEGTDTGLANVIGGTDYAGGICNKDGGDPTCNNTCNGSGRCLQYTKAIPNIGLVIYASDNLWIEGTVKGRVTIATANTNASNTNPNANNNALI